MQVLRVLGHPTGGQPVCKGGGMRLFRGCRLLFLSWLLPAWLGAANLVFVFHGSVPTISIYNADTLELLGTPSIGGGGLKAFGVPDPANPGQFLKFYILTANSIVVLNPVAPFSTRATLPFSGTIAAATNAAVMTPDGRRLLVAAGGVVNVVNTTDAGDTISATVSTGAPPSGIAVLPNSKRAYVLQQTSQNIAVLDLTASPPVLLGTSISIPSAVPTAIGMAPNGFRLYTSIPSQIFDIDRISLTPGAAIASTTFSSVSSITFD